MLEIFISLYELRQSTLQEVFLRPSNQFEVYNENDDFLQKHYVSDYAHFPMFMFMQPIAVSHIPILPIKFQQSIIDKMYEKCAMSVYGDSKILLLNGGVGTGKTAFIRHLLLRFAKENFQITNSILVCGRNNALVDAMAIQMINKVKRSSSKDISNREIVVQVPNYFGEKEILQNFGV